MKIASWNVNSLKVRLPHVQQWMANDTPDVVALQEIKQVTEDFPHEAFKASGYRAIASGQKTYNGVATISRSTQEDAVTDFPGFSDEQRRILATTIDGVRIVNVYVPNGSRVGSEKYDYKLSWLAELRLFLASELAEHEYVVVLGDFNIAPADLDVHDPVRWGEGILCSPKERAALSTLLELGFVDVFRAHAPDTQEFSWWDYRAGGFRRNMGLRIDLILANQALASRCTDSYINREPRSWERPSDHTPVIAAFDV